MYLITGSPADVPFLAAATQGSPALGPVMADVQLTVVAVRYVAESGSLIVGSYDSISHCSIM